MGCGELSVQSEKGIVVNWQGRVAFSFTLLLEGGSELSTAVPLPPGMLVVVSVPTLKLPS